MDEEPNLPRLPVGVMWRENQGLVRDPSFRKRGRRDSTDSRRKFESSDPAIFSSDDDPAIDNYIEGGRRKRRYVGSWFHQQPLPSSSDSAFDEPMVSRPLPKTRRTFKRQLDSGVWLGSDSTDDGFEDVQLTKQTKLPAPEPIAPPPKPVISEAEREAQRLIQTCLEEGNETVDLSAIGLETFSAGTIRPLNDIAPIPLVAKDVPFEQNPPSIKLILARNPLIRMPSAICDLENLTLLSLRGCGLTELPPAIGRLTKLQTLNLAQNRLTFLPGELLNLLAIPSTLQDLFLQGNKFRKAAPLQVPNNIPNSLRSLLSEASVGGTRPGRDASLLTQSVGVPPEGTYECMGAQFLARSHVEYSEPTGRRAFEFSLEGPFEDDRVPLALPSVIDSNPFTSYAAVTHAPPPKAGIVPSLLELAARSCYRSPDLAELADYLPDSLPGPRDAVERAIEQRIVGGQRCAGCSKVMVTPAVRWLEWWKVASLSRGEAGLSTKPWTEDAEEQAVPFMRKGCSWKCVPQSEAVGGWKGGVTLGAE